MTKITILIPCYNEVNTIEKLIEKVLKSEISDKEVIIIDDFSTDGTKEILQSKLNKLVKKIVYHDKNLGKGACIRSGMEHVTGEIIIIQDADLEYNPNEYKKLIEPITNGQADVVYGSRFQGGGSKRVLYFWNRVANYFLTILSNIFTNINLTDMETGYKCFTTKAAKSIALVENRFGFEPEITAKLAKKKYRFVEIGISYNGRTYDEGKKIRAIDGIKAIYYIFKYNLFK